MMRLSLRSLVLIALIVLVGAAGAYTVSPCSFPDNIVPGGALREPPTTITPTTPAIGYLKATNGVLLAYYPYVSVHPIATLIFYHGSGANSAAGYLPIGQELRDIYHIATFLVDFRGHGESGGPRDDAPIPHQVWMDVGTVVQ